MDTANEMSAANESAVRLFLCFNLDPLLDMDSQWLSHFSVDLQDHERDQ